ncbi:MAG: Anthranilate synthase, amidotransferase component @ Para-aminobenzoate synthase, amidotransferase component [uncultured Nocardioidaceae bacterium]|uniref:Anthranilate synthase, amidotransferase component @ Para-aminobenzoate synthase, amidotransferase component n=1 Tax=uncultured Nocardioidaceae bacterium TaxID=253824 RepID=A0A6J4MJ11_9ACTN|nr:MAG: Anthranilate synthase, amidotransferase component @ Para-aminobenzoate synthase, amidotransferase component [uncultured Nocardioidaceae bacterium]
MPARPRVVVVDHHDSYTWNLVHLLAAVTGELPEVVLHDRVRPADLAGATHLVLSPGPGHPAQPADFALGPDVFALGVPVLGVCLGMQALVHAFGGTVAVAAPAHGEVAQVDHDGRGVFTGVPQRFDAVRYHSLQAVRLPDCLEVTATCPAGRADGGPAVMGVRHRSLPLEGVQFHPESVLTEHGAALVGNFLAGR